MIFYIKLAERVIRVTSLYEYVYWQCKDYIVDETEPDIVVEITEKDIEYEKEVSLRNEGDIRIRPESLESLAVYRKIAEGMIQYDTFLMHGCVVASGNEAVMITAPSGTGKTSVTWKLLKTVKDSFVLNGDKPLIRYVDGELVVYGTPWCGKERMNRNTNAILKRIYLLQRGDTYVHKKLKSIEAFPVLFQQSYRTNSPDYTKKVVHLLSLVMENTECISLSVPYADSVNDIQVGDLFSGNLK